VLEVTHTRPKCLRLRSCAAMKPRISFSPARTIRMLGISRNSMPSLLISAHRLGEPEPEGLPLDPEMETTLNELEKNWKSQPQKQHDRER